MWLGCLVLSIGAALQASAYGIPQMIIGKIIAGLCNGINASTIRKCDHDHEVRTGVAIPKVAVWHSELMKAHKRGKGLSIELAINVFGLALSYWVDFGMSLVGREAQFRFPLALQILFAIITFGAM